MRVLSGQARARSGSRSRLRPPFGERLSADTLEKVLERRNYARILIRIFVGQPDVNVDEIGPRVESVVGRLMVFFKEGTDAGAFRRGSLHGILVDPEDAQHG